LAIDRDSGQQMLAAARVHNRRIGCAPDTFLGGGLQTCRHLIDEGQIGRPVAGTAFMMCHGHESWHPNPGFYYLAGGGPVFDMGPYYLTALVHLLGPVRRVSGTAVQTFTERIATSQARYGQRLPVEVPTHVAGTLEFHGGAVITLVMSFDVWYHSNHPIEIHGEKGSMQVPDPNRFGGTVRIRRPGDDDWKQIPLTHGYTDNMRGIGVADMAYALVANRPHRCHSDLAYHVLDVMQALHESSVQGKHILIESRCEPPAPLPLHVKEGSLGDNLEVFK
jgi:predicted dehydrogenase